MNHPHSTILGICFCIVFLLSTFHGHAQKNNTGTFLFEGVVYGYNYEPSKGLLKKSKQFVMDGLLDEVNLTLYHRNTVVYTSQTNKDGEFSIPVPTNAVYTLEFSKAGYEKNILELDMRSIPKRKLNEGVAFTGAEFMLNSFIPGTEADPDPIGKLNYDPARKCFEFIVSFNKSPKTTNSADLIKKAVSKNNNPSAVSLSGVSAKANSSASLRKDSVSVKSKKKSPVQDFIVTPAGIGNIKAEDIAYRRSQIERSRATLNEYKKRAMSKEDSLIIDAKEAVILAAEVELQNALQLIDTQESEIRYQKRALYAILAGLLLLAGLSIILYIYYKDKKHTNEVLAAKNKDILDSITYAKRIQQSFLIDEEEIKKVLPDIFIYYQPKDIVSGDFYWFSKVNNKIIIAVVDCTGHGVPGAFMSLIANTLLNEIVNEKHIIDPGSILQHLHSGITTSLHQEKDNSSSYDGMDMGLCIIDKNKNTLSYAGAMHPLYISYNHSIEVIKADMYPVGGRKLRSAINNIRQFTTHTIDVKKGMSFYMFSDGYVDQFNKERKNKFSTERFKQLLMGMENEGMEKQKEIIQQTMERWRGDFKQIDDILVVGMKA